MSINETKPAFVNAASVSISLSQMFSVSTTGTNPTYLVVSLLDRNEYTAAATGAFGSLTGNGKTLSPTSIGSDGYGAGILFTYAGNGQYYNSTYGYWSKLTYISSSSPNDLANITLYATNNLADVQSYDSNPWNMIYYDSAEAIGSVTVATQPKFAGSVPSQATPSSIAAVAQGFVGQAWNMNGCWVLASTIAAEAGTSLPAASTAVATTGEPNGEWIVAYNGPAGQTGNWQSMVTAGEMIAFATAAGSGHITTCVSGSGSSAMLVDNITYVNASGAVQNGANDGSANDVLIAAPHAASQEFSGVSAASVVIYELDAPIVTATTTTVPLACKASMSLGSLFTAADPGTRGITQWQIYDTAATDLLSYQGATTADHTAATALTAASLSAVSLLAGSAATTDTVDVRAYNGAYWGDWTALTVNVVPTAPSAPVLVTQTASQTWTTGVPVALTLPAGSFTDPQNQALTYSATLSNGQALPSWLTFNPATDTLSGTPPATAQTLGIIIRATDTSGLSAIDAFNATVIAPPAVTSQTAAQVWTEGQAINLALPAGTFTDPQNQALTYSATLSNGQALPSWLTFNATTRTFSGTAPNTAQSLSLQVTATDTSHLSASETFTATVQPTPPVSKTGIALTNPTPAQTWTDGSTVNLQLAANTFTDAAGLRMSFTAYQVGGTDVTSWLGFNPATDAFAGLVPSTATGTAQLEVVASDANGYSAADVFTVNLATPVGGATHTAAPASLATHPHGPGLMLMHML